MLDFPASYDSINRIILQQSKMLHNCQLIYRSLSYSSYSCKFSTPDHASTASHDFVTGSKDGSANISVLKKLRGCNVFSVADNRSFSERALLVQHLGNRRISGLAYDTLILTNQRPSMMIKGYLRWIAKRANDVMTQTRYRQTNWNGGWFWRFL